MQFPATLVQLAERPPSHGQTGKNSETGSIHFMHFPATLVHWKGSSWRLVCVLDMLKITLIVSNETCKEVTQLVSTSDKRSSSGEMKIDLKRVGIYREMDLTLVKIKDELWSLIFTPRLEVDWSVISVMGKCEVTFAIKSDVWWHIFTLYCGVFGDEGMTLLNSCQVLKSWPIVFDICLIKPKYSL